MIFFIIITINQEAEIENMTEYIDIVDENGEPTGDVIDRETAHSKGIRHRTAHVWLLRNNNDKVQILLQKRCQTKSSYPGCYDISSAGHIPSGVDYIQSALRELNEELGIIASPEELIYCGDRKIVSDKVFFGREFHDRQVSKVFIMWKDIDESGFSLQKEEVDEVRWFDLDECIRAVNSNTLMHCIVPEELLMVQRTAEATAPR